MKRVLATAASTCFIVSGSSNAAGAGGAPLMSRIQAAWRASTVWIASAASSIASDLTRGAWPA